jgi:hypothetical protein
MNWTDRGTPPVVTFAVNDATGVVAPAAAGRSASPAARRRKSHAVVCFILVIQAFGGNRPGLREGSGYFPGPVIAPDAPPEYILSVHGRGAIIVRAGD